MIAVLTGRRGGARRGVQHQMPRRTLERTCRVGVVAFARWARTFAGWSWEQVADAVRVKVDTLRRWYVRWREDRLSIEPRGRPVQRADTEVRNLVLAVLGLAGPGVSVATLQALFPLVARRELEDLVRRYRTVYRKRGTLLHVLSWDNCGAVWAMDFTEAPTPIDGTYRYVLVVRDLASGKSLLSLPTETVAHGVVVDALTALFAEHGAPLVIKSDNGSGFIADPVRAMLADRGVVLLLSPPGTPRFNGAVEAGIGGLKTRAHYLAASHGRPGEWTCDDVEGARLMANETARPRGKAMPTPDELWEARLPFTEGDRRRLREAVKTLTKEERARFTTTRDGGPSKRDEQAAERIAIVRALHELGHLRFRRRRFSLPIQLRRTGKNS